MKKGLATFLTLVFVMQIIFSSIIFATDYQNTVDTAIAQINELETLIANCKNKGITPDYEIADFEIANLFATKLQNEYNANNTSNVDYYAGFINEVYSDIQPKLKKFAISKSAIS